MVADLNLLGLVRDLFCFSNTLKFLVAILCCPLVFEFSVGIGVFVIGLSEISFFFSQYIYSPLSVCPCVCSHSVRAITSYPLVWSGEEERDLTQSYDKSPYTHRKIQKATWQHKNATKNFGYSTIVDRLRTLSWGNDSHPTGVVKPVYGIPTFPLIAKAV